MSKESSAATIAREVGRQNNHGCWTGWVADMRLIKSIANKTMPTTYLEHYPRNRATTLNTWLSRFGIYSNGMFFELDRAGSKMIKDVIKHSPSARGFYVRIDGIRKGDKIQVKGVREIANDTLSTDPDFHRIAQRQLRGEFGKMGI